jgi:hypothetical protein
MATGVLSVRAELSVETDLELLQVISPQRQARDRHAGARDTARDIAR